LGIRKNKDVDIVVSKEIFNLLKKTGKFTIRVDHDREILNDNIFEILTFWSVLGRDHKYKDLLKESVVIDKVRYITLDFLYKVKKSWVEGKYARPKDIEDVKLIERYKASYKA